MYYLKSLTDTPTVQVPLLPKVFHGKADEDVQSWFANSEVVFFTKGISSCEDKPRWTRAFVNDAAERYFDIFPFVNSWEEFCVSFDSKIHPRVY